MLFLVLVHVEITHAEIIEQPIETLVLVLVQQQTEIMLFVSLLEDAFGLSLRDNSNFLDWRS
ncbi:hypothetical protein [Sporosarcina sp. FSL K6-3457]|uniref:hypothetical protein n=1 Tax=Sporosarcina sp. FSL K6-3457 TaxID=2978204 RepID=UPI0030FC0C7E